MPVSSTDILLKYSVKTGSAGNSQAGTAAGSLGKYISTTQALTSLHGLFDAITAAENAASENEYRCIFVHNNHGTISFDNVKVFIAAETGGGANIAIGVDPTAASAIASAGAQAVEVANEDTAPAGVTFTSPTTLGAAIVLGNIPVGQCKALWVRRAATNSGAISADGGTLRVQGESI
jgi:hypothetical protein